MENWQQKGTSLLLLDKFFPGLKKARSAAAKFKCIPNLKNPSVPIIVDVPSVEASNLFHSVGSTIKQSTESTNSSLSSCPNLPDKAVSNKVSENPRFDDVNLSNATSGRGKRESLPKYSPNKLLNSRLYLCAGFPAEVKASFMLNLRVKVGHEAITSAQTLPFCDKLPSSCVSTSEIINDTPKTSDQLSATFLNAYNRMLFKVAKVSKQTLHKDEANPHLKDCETNFSAMIPEVNINTTNYGSEQTGSLKMPTAKTEDKYTGSGYINHSNNFIIIPFPLGHSHSTQVSVEEYAVHFVFTLRHLMTVSSDNILQRYRIAVIAFDAQQQEALETCFQMFFPVEICT